MIRQRLENCQRIVVKAGTSILTSEGNISKKQIERLGEGILKLREGRSVALVSSGAIAFGMESCGFKKRPKKLSELQACAAVGQGKLMHAYEQFFARQNVVTAQLLLTRDGLETRPRFLAARNTFEELFKKNVLPIVNENDTVATEEIAFSDNDILSVHVAHLIHADLLIILSDVDGFYLEDHTRIRQVTASADIDKELAPHVRDSKKEKTVGGMRAKLEAARVAMRLGVPMIIVSGHSEGILEKVIQGEDVGTLFWMEEETNNARKKWIAFSAKKQGALVLDEGAYDALRVKQKSLLASGIHRVKGQFEKGHVVELENASGQVFGRGVVRFSSEELHQIKGRRSDEIFTILGPRPAGVEVIHRNDLVLWS